jgi:hypothetical protein
MVIGLILCCGVQMTGAEWIDVDPTQIVPGSETMTVSHTSGPPPALQVESRTPGDLKWVTVSLPVPFGQSIDMVEVCYQAPDDGTFIRQTRLVEALDAQRGLVIHDDPTTHASPRAACYRSAVYDYTPIAALSLWVRLEVAQAGDVLYIDGVRIHLR